VVGRGNDDDVGGKRVDVEQKGAHDSLDLSGLVLVASLLADGVELVEEDYAAPRTHVLHEPGEPHRRLPEIAPDHAIVADDQERKAELTCERLCERGLAVTGRACQQDPVSRFEGVRAEKVRALLLLDQFLARARDVVREHQIVEDAIGTPLVVRADGCVVRQRSRAVRFRGEVLG
jgi:hypothetical protein